MFREAPYLISAASVAGSKEADGPIGKLFDVTDKDDLYLGYSDSEDITVERALDLYDKYMTETKELMYAKNHDYDEAWRSMRISSYTDLILTKICRTKQIENNNGKTLVSEGVDANYMDMINYSLFGLIKIEYGEQDD